jgi:DNA-directed RNA polymerase specialized sigma24 family protein
MGPAWAGGGAIPGCTMSGAPSAGPVPGPRTPRVTGAFEEWFRDHYQWLIANLRALGADGDEAEELAAEAATCLLENWEKVRSPSAYARQAAIHLLIKNRERGPGRLTKRMIAKGEVMSDRDDPALAVWEDQQWVMSLLKSLPAAQAEVLAWAVDEFAPKEIAVLLGKTPEAVRRALLDARKRLKHDLAMAEAAVAVLAKTGDRSSPAALVSSKEEK